MNPKKYTYLAIDIGKAELQIDTGNKSIKLPNDSEGYRELLRELAKLKDPLVACEATGGYERGLIATLSQSGRAYAVINPARVRAFARSEGIKAKTDPIDAAVILKFANEKRLGPSKAASPMQLKLNALLDRRSQLSGELAREKNRLQNSPACLSRSIGKMVRFLTKEIGLIESRIRKVLANDAKAAAQIQAIVSVKGVGEVTAWTLLAYLPEIASLGRSQLAALVGVAPYNRDSSSRSAPRRIQGGRAKVRRCLYLAAQVAAVHNPVIKPYFEALRKRGKAYKCAIVAVMRKLLIHISSLLKTDELALV